MLRLLTTKVDQWWQVHFPAMSKQPHSKTLETSNHRPLVSHRAFELFKPLRAPQKSSQVNQSKAATSSLLKRPPRCKDQLTHPQAAFALAVVVLTAAVGQRFYNQPQLQVDTEAPQTIAAPTSVDLVDAQTTEERRIAARNGALRVLMLDAEANRKITQTLENFIKQGDDLRQGAGVLPFLETSLLSTNTQRYIRQADENTWQKIWLLARTPIRENALSQSGLQSRTYDLTSIQQRALEELLSYRARVSAQEFAALSVVIEDNRARYRQAISDMNVWLQRDASSPFDAALFDLSEGEWKTSQAVLRQVAHRMIAQGVPQGFPADLKEEAIRIQLNGLAPGKAQILSMRILMLVLQPNLVEDIERTRLQAEQAAEAVEPVTVSVSQGEVIVRAGDKITQADFVLLDHFDLSRRRFNWLGLGGFGVLMGGGVSVFLLVEHFYHPGLRRRDYILITLLALTPAGLIALGFPALSFPAVGLLLGSFYGSALGTAVIGLLSIVLPIGASVSPIAPLISSTAGALVGSLIASRLRSREELALLGGFVGLTQGAVHLVLTLMLSPVSTAFWLAILSTSALQGLYGVAWSVVALGLSPYLEHLFDLVTPIRLAELSNPNRPLLKRLASEAPGTFQHTLFVASLAEAAARELGCNVELVRAGTLYHDIGKMHDPLGFIENQMGGPNKHDQMADPWKSAEIIKKHVDEGVVMARKHRLPKALQAFIPEHQGNMLISYFYHQAQQRAKDNPRIAIDESDFRYDGPIPQTPETGIVMLADSCEAALRSLKDATPEEAFAMVNKILRARWKDHQLVDSCLTRENMSTIAQIFVQVWQQYNHKRIVYPKVLPTKPMR